MNDRGPARDLMRRAAAAGYEALVFTTDANVFGSREWDRRNYRAPGKPTLRTLARHAAPSALAARPARARRATVPQSRVVPAAANRRARSAAARSCRSSSTPASPGRTSQWIRDAWRGKLLVKGVLDVRDAERAVSLGCDGIVLSNHGGRQLDSCVARSRCCRRSCAPSARAPRSSSTAVFAAAPTSSRRWHSARTQSCSAGRRSTAWPPAARPAWRMRSAILVSETRPRAR